METIGHAATNDRFSSPAILPGRQTSKTKRVLLADDDPLVRAAVTVLFAHHKGFTIVGEATNGEEAITLAAELKPDLLLLDLNMPKKTGFDTLRDLRDGALRSIHTILLTVSIDKQQIAEALQLGARGIVLKEAARSLLMDAVANVMKGRYWINQKAMNDISTLIAGVPPLKNGETSKPLLLTPKESQIVASIVAGCTNKDIARTLVTSEQVIKNHLGKIFDKLGVFNRLELALYALDHNLATRH